MQGLKDAWTQGRRTRGVGGCRDVGRRDVGLGDIGTQGHDKQTTLEFCAEFVIYNFRWSRGRYYMPESLPADQ